MMKGRRRTKKDRGFSLIEILIALVVVSVISAISAPSLIKSKAAANEGAAIASVRQLITAEAAYSALRGNGQFGTLANLTNSGLIDDNLGSGLKHGYNFEVTPNGGAGFTVTAIPANQGSDGPHRGFYGDSTGVIRFSSDGSKPDSSSPALSFTTGGWAVIEDPDQP